MKPAVEPLRNLKSFRADCASSSSSTYLESCLQGSMEQIALATIVTTCTMVCYSLLQQTPKMLQQILKASYQPGMTSYICHMHVGQGFCLAIEDAVVLAWHLRRQGFSPQALRRSASATVITVAKLCPSADRQQGLPGIQLVFVSLDVAMDVPLTLAVEFGCSIGTHALIGKASLIDVLTCQDTKLCNCARLW